MRPSGANPGGNWVASSAQACADLRRWLSALHVAPAVVAQVPPAVVAPAAVAPAVVAPL
jgi:hypothetical protein